MKITTPDAATRTVIEESGQNYLVKWQDGDKIGVYEVANGEVQNKTTSSALDFDSGDPTVSTSGTATFTLSFGGTPSAPYDYSFIYPSSALDKSGEKYRVRLNKNQSFAANSFDPAADIMISEHVHEATERPASRNLRFARIGATARMVIKAPSTSENILKITFSTTEGNMSGLYELTPVDGTLSSLYSGDKEIVLTPAASTAYTGNIVVWFRCAAITLSDNFTVVVKTNLKTYTKEVNLASASRTLEFAQGKLSKFNVDMTGVSGVANPTLDNGLYAIVAEKNGSYYALSNTASTTRLATVNLGTSFNTGETYETDDETIVWKLVNGTGNITLQDAKNNYLRSGSSAASTNASSQNFTLNQAVVGKYEINSASHGGIRYNTSAAYWAFYTSDKSTSMIGDVYFVPVNIDKTPVLGIDNIILEDNFTISDETIEFATRKFISSLTVDGVYNEVGRTSACSWATVEVSDGVLKFSVTKNTSTIDRIAYVRVTGSNGEGGNTTVDFTITQPGKEIYDNQWIRVKDITELEEGDVIVIANRNSAKTAGAISGTYLTVVSSTFSLDGKEITSLGAGSEQFTLGKDNSNWTFSFSDDNLLGTSSAKTVTKGSGTAVNTWTISFSGNNAIVSSTTGANGTLQFNSDRFTTYTSTQSVIQIYKWYEDPSAKTIKTNKSSIVDVVSAGVINATLTDAYTLKNASDGDLTVTVDNTVVTSASASGGTVTYTVAANTGAARSTGWIKIAVAGGNEITISVSQLAAQYTLTLAGTNGSVTATVGGNSKTSGSLIDCGATVTITATPTSGYSFDAWDVYKTGDSSTKVSTASAVSPTTFTMPSYNVTASASFIDAGLTDWSTTYTSNVTMSAGSNSSAAAVVINKTNYSAIKCGTTSKAGVATVSVPSGTSKLHVHIAGWNGENGKTVNVTTSAGTISKINNVSTTSLTTTADTGVSGSTPFTLAGTSVLSTSYYYVIDLTGITKTTTITFTANSASNNRFVIWGCNAE